jgi:hypothetical protein
MPPEYQYHDGWDFKRFENGLISKEEHFLKAVKHA